MTRNRQLPYLDILEVNKDSIGPYAKIHVSLEDGEIIIRWGLDEFTYTNLSKTVSGRYFDTMPGLHYKFRLLLITSSCRSNENTFKYESNAECSFRRQKKNIVFPCSKLFASNISWFRDVKRVNDLQDLEWKDV